MTKYLEDKRASLILVIVCFITYAIIGLTRNAYSAAIAGIVSEGYFSKSQAGVIATSFNITYCLSQIVGSYFVDKVSPFKIILLGTIVTIFANVAMSINPTYWVIFIARGVRDRNLSREAIVAKGEKSSVYCSGARTANRHR